jgi:hypothetical protein
MRKIALIRDTRKIAERIYRMTEFLQHEDSTTKAIFSNLKYSTKKLGRKSLRAGRI